MTTQNVFEQRRVFVMRGLPGEGKSSMTKALCKWLRPQIGQANVVVVSTDLFWYDEDDNYNFDISKLSEAHAWCLNTYHDLLVGKIPVIIVDNCNIHAWEAAPYMQLAIAHHYDPALIDVVAVSPSMDVFARQRHGVPWKTWANMKRAREVEQFPPHWTRMVMTSDPVRLNAGFDVMAKDILRG